MAKIAAPRVEGGESEYEKRQVYRVQNGLYGLMFAWYTLPKTYAKFQSTETEEKFFAGFVITHDRAGRQLDHFSDALMTVRPKLFFSEENGMKSAYVSLIHALSAGKLSPSEIANMEEDDLPDLDEYIGRPVWGFIEANQKPDKNGLYGRKVKGIEPMDKALWESAKPLYNGRKTEVTKAGLVRLVEPTAAYEDEVGVGGTADANPFDEGDELEIPF